MNKIGDKYDKDKLPMHTVLYRQFPLAIKEIVKCSQAGHLKYPNDIDWMNFKRVPDGINRYLNAALRHLNEEGVNIDMKEYLEVLHEAQAIWNLLAALQIKLENKNENNNK